MSHSFLLTTAVLATLALSGCGGDSSSTTGPAMAAPAPTAAPAQAAAPAPAPQRFQVNAGTRPGRIDGHVSINGTGIAGTRGTATAIDGEIYKFRHWDSSSSDCPGETTNPCSFAYDRNKTLIAVFSGS